MRISAVLIVYNEEVLLPRCLESLRGIDEIVISDSGCTDKTMEIAAKYTDKLFAYKWHDNFAASRNAAKSHATGDWILSIDADEILHDLGAVREAVALAEQQGIKAVNCTLISETAKKQKTSYPRLFKNDPETFWEGAIHNSLSVQGRDIGNVEITYGWSPAHNDDPDRAFRILKKEVATRPTANRERFYLGREYLYRKEYQNCIDVLSVYVNSSRFLSEKAEAFFMLAQCYWNLRQPDQARDCCGQALIINANFKEAILFMADMSWEHSARQWRKMAETADNSNVLFVREI